MSNPNDIKRKLEKRHARPMSIGAGLGELFRTLGIRASDADLANRWTDIMGTEIASIATLASIKKTRDEKFNIVLRPATPAFALQLSYMSDEIINRINKYFGYDAVGKISFKK